MNDRAPTRTGGLGPLVTPSGATPTTPAASTARPSVIQLVFREKGALYAAYMPMLTDGGLFVPCLLYTSRCV